MSLAQRFLEWHKKFGVPEELRVPYEIEIPKPAPSPTPTPSPPLRPTVIEDLVKPTPSDLARRFLEWHKKFGIPEELRKPYEIEIKPTPRPTPTPTPTPAPTPVEKKEAEVDIHFIRLPFVTDEQIKNGMLNLVNGVLKIFAPKMYAKNPVLTQTSWATWKCTLEIYSTASPAPWVLIAGVILGAVLAYAIIYFVEIRPLKETLVKLSKKLVEVMNEKEKALAEGRISKDFADRLNKMLKEAEEDARRAGEDPLRDWFKHFQPIVEFLPTFLMLILLIALISAVPLPKRRD